MREPDAEEDQGEEEKGGFRWEKCVEMQVMEGPAGKGEGVGVGVGGGHTAGREAARQEGTRAANWPSGQDCSPRGPSLASLTPRRPPHPHTPLGRVCWTTQPHTP